LPHKNKSCNFKVATDDDAKTTKSDPCNKNCDTSIDLVCLKGEQLFSNECIMDETVCKADMTITEEDWHKGPCTDAERKNWAGGDNKADEMECPDKGCPRSYHPICASNGITYENECLFRDIVCKNNLEDLRVVQKAPCDFIRGGGSDLGCPPALCTRELDPVCASNDQTYANRCLFEAASECDPGIKLKHMGMCGTQGRSVCDTGCLQFVNRLNLLQRSENSILKRQPNKLKVTGEVSTNI
jgi:hypothetical protein